MEGRTGKRKCFANVENFWPAFFLRPVCQGEKEIGGWMASTNRGEGVYFTYCGGMKVNNKVYLDVTSGKTSR